MRFIDNMTPQELETLALKGMTAPRRRMTAQIRHEESGCTDYLQHPWESCPENPKRNDPNKNWTMYHPDKAAPNKAQPQHSGLQEMADAAQYLGMHPDKINAVCDKYTRAVNHADKLAEALRDVLNNVDVLEARQTLKDWDESEAQ